MEAATIERNDVNQTTSTTTTNHTMASSGGKKKVENNLAMQQPKQQQGSLFNDIIRHLIYAYIEAILLFPSM